MKLAALHQLPGSTLNARECLPERGNIRIVLLAQEHELNFDLIVGHLDESVQELFRWWHSAAIMGMVPEQRRLDWVGQQVFECTQSLHADQLVTLVVDHFDDFFGVLHFELFQVNIDIQ